MSFFLNVQLYSSSIPPEKASPNHDTASLLWMPREVEIVTSGFSEKNRISESVFATTYRGQRDNAHYVVKKLKEVGVCLHLSHELNKMRKACAKLVNNRRASIQPYWIPGTAIPIPSIVFLEKDTSHTLEKVCNNFRGHLLFIYLKPRMAKSEPNLAREDKFKNLDPQLLLGVEKSRLGLL